MRVAMDLFGAPDILVNNAVIRHFLAGREFSVDRWELALAVNLSSAFHTIRLAIPGMRARNWGRIINIASDPPYIGSVHRIDYGTTKTALLGMTRSVAMETATTGITCNAICPGTVLTEAIDERIVAMMKEKNLSRQDAEKQFLCAHATRWPLCEGIERCRPRRLSLLRAWRRHDRRGTFDGSRLAGEALRWCPAARSIRICCPLRNKAEPKCNEV